MVHITRLFSRDELEDLDVPYKMVTEEITDQSRWYTYHTGVFRDPETELYYEIDWQEGSTEMQECDTWNDEDEVLATQVEYKEVLEWKWVPVSE